MPIVTQATVTDVVSEFNGQGTGPYSLFNVGGITSGQIYDKVKEANSFLQQAVSLGASTPSDAGLVEAIKRFEVNYASARLGMDLMGVVTTDGFNYNVAGVSVQRATAEIQAIKTFTDNHLMVAKWWLTQLNPWFYVYNSSNFEGT